MWFRFAIAITLLSATAAYAQPSERTWVLHKGPSLPLHELPELTPEKKTQCLKEANIKKRIENFRECDDGGCYFDVPRVLDLTQQQELDCRKQHALQRELQRLADEARKKWIEDERERRKSN